MGMEDGSNYFESGGGGDYGGGDIGVGGDFNYGYGSGGSDFVLDPGFGLDTSGAPVDWGFDTTSWPTLDQGGAGATTADQGLGLDVSSGLIDVGNGYMYDPVADQFFDTGLYQQGTDYGAGDSDYWRQAYENWQAFGLDPATAAQMASQDLQDYKESQGVINIAGAEPGAPPVLPDLPQGQFFPLPYVNNYNSPPYVPTFPEGPAPPPPSLPPSPASAQPNLPPACAAGTYHPYPIGDPRQNLCVAFPAPQTSAPRTSTGTQSAPAAKPPATAPKPQTQQACPQGYYRASSGQCLPIPRCTTPGTVFDSRSGRCVPTGQSSAPGCPPGEWFNPQTRRCEIAPACATPGTVFDVNRGLCVPPDQLTSGEDIFGGLKNIPWWLWLAAAGLFLLGGNDDSGRKTTVYHRRAA